MASLRYHAGRMVLYAVPSGWRVRIKPREGDKVDLPLNSVELEAAVIEAEQLYADVRGITNTRPTCQQCLHWEYVKAACGLGFPEGRTSGGRFATKCSAYWPD